LVGKLYGKDQKLGSRVLASHERVQAPNEMLQTKTHVAIILYTNHVIHKQA